MIKNNESCVLIKSKNKFLTKKAINLFTDNLQNNYLMLITKKDFKKDDFIKCINDNSSLLNNLAYQYDHNQHITNNINDLKNNTGVASAGYLNQIYQYSRYSNNNKIDIINNYFKSSDKLIEILKYFSNEIFQTPNFEFLGLSTVKNYLTDEYYQDNYLTIEGNIGRLDLLKENIKKHNDYYSFIESSLNKEYDIHIVNLDDHRKIKSIRKGFINIDPVKRLEKYFKDIENLRTEILSNKTSFIDESINRNSLYVVYVNDESNEGFVNNGYHLSELKDATLFNTQKQAENKLKKYKNGKILDVNIDITKTLVSKGNDGDIYLKLIAQQEKKKLDEFLSNKKYIEMEEKIKRLEKLLDDNNIVHKEVVEEKIVPVKKFKL